MTLTFALRILMSTWGIAIDLHARSRFLNEAPAGALSAGDRTWVDVSRVKLGEADIAQLVFGLSLVSSMIQMQHTLGHIVVEVQQVDYVPTDYQVEGMAAAMVGWATEAFDLVQPTFVVEFDKTTNRYVFLW